jgi:hypothetical protein
VQARCVAVGLPQLPCHHDGPEGRRVAAHRRRGVGMRDGPRLALEAQRDSGALEQLAHVALVAPGQRRVREARGRRQVRGDGAEEVADGALGRPRDQPDAPARAQDPGELVGHDLVARGELRTERGQHEVEVPVGEGQRLGVPLDPLGVDPRVGGASARHLEHLRGEVESRHPGARLRGGDGSVAGAGGDVEHTLAVVGAEPADQPSADLVQALLAHHRVVVPARPRGRAASPGSRATVAWRAPFVGLVDRVWGTRAGGRFAHAGQPAERRG